MLSKNSDINNTFFRQSLHTVQCILPTLHDKSTQKKCTRILKNMVEHKILKFKLMLEIYILVANCTVVHILEPQTFLILWSAGFEQLEWRKTGQ